MSAKVDKAFSVRESMWWQGTSEDHGQGTVVSEHPTWEEAKVLAGLDGWEPARGDLAHPLREDDLRASLADVMYNAELTEAERLDALVDAAKGAQDILDGFKRIYRTDTNATLSVMSDTYQVINNSDFGEIFDAVLGQGNVKFETGGVLEGGKSVWMLSYLDEPITLPGDETFTMPYLALMSRNDGMGGTVLRPTNVRIVCKNTYNLAEMGVAGYTVRGKNNGQYTFVHRGDWRSRFEQARQAVGSARTQAKAYQAWAADMLLVKVTKTTERKFVNTFIPEPPAGTTSDRVKANIEASRDKLREILAGPTVAGAGIGGTGWGLVSGAVEYLDHARNARSWETKLNRTLLRPETLKAQAVSIVKELAAA